MRAGDGAPRAQTFDMCTCRCDRDGENALRVAVDHICLLGFLLGDDRFAPVSDTRLADPGALPHPVQGLDRCAICASVQASVDGIQGPSGALFGFPPARGRTENVLTAQVLRATSPAFEGRLGAARKP